MTITVGADVASTISDFDEGKGFKVGDRHCGVDGKEYVYVTAASAITGAGYVVFFDEDYSAVELSTSNDAFGEHVGVAPVAFNSGDYGWVQIKGTANIRVAASAAANAQLNATATAGQLDDDQAVGSVDLIGIVLTTANGASAGTAEGRLNYPTIAFVAN